MSNRFLSRAELAARRALRRRRTRLRQLGALAGAGLVLLAGILISDASSRTHHRHAARAAAPRALGLAALPARSAARLARADQAIARVLGYTSYVAVGAGRRRDVALTFDDGPGPST